MTVSGMHILRGMAITLGHLIRTYVYDVKRLLGRPHHRTIHAGNGKDPRPRVSQDPGHEGVFTVQYPEERLATPERFRVLPVLIYEEADGNVLCTSCGICAKVCPPQCIWIVQAKNPDGKPFPKAAEFFIDMDVCMNCGLCSEFCPFDAIKMDHQFELSNSERDKSHVYNLQELLVSTDYYAETHPKAWAKEEAKRAAAAKAKEKPA